LKLCIVQDCNKKVFGHGLCKTHYDQKFAERRRQLVNLHIAEMRLVLDDIKLSSGCIDCGYNEHAEALDFDHVKGQKKFNVSIISTRSLESLMEEIAKCEVVCANCHRVRTKQRRKGESDKHSV